MTAALSPHDGNDKLRCEKRRFEIQIENFTDNFSWSIFNGSIVAKGSIVDENIDPAKPILARLTNLFDVLCWAQSQWRDACGPPGAFAFSPRRAHHLFASRQKHQLCSLGSQCNGCRPADSAGCAGDDDALV